MARIEGIRHRLENWARWCAKVEGGALGFPTTNTLARLAGRGSGYTTVVPTNDVEAAETDEAVKSLQFVRSHLYLVLTLHYAKGLEIHKVAREMGRAESTIKRNLEDADAAIQAWLVEKAEKQRAAK